MCVCVCVCVEVLLRHAARALAFYAPFREDCRFKTEPFMGTDVSLMEGVEGDISCGGTTGACTAMRRGVIMAHVLDHAHVRTFQATGLEQHRELLRWIAGLLNRIEDASLKFYQRGGRWRWRRSGAQSRRGWRA